MKLGSLLKNRKACLGLVCGSRVLDVTSAARHTKSAVGALAHSRDVAPIWKSSTHALLERLHREVSVQGVPFEWEGYCQDIESCHWLPPVRNPEKIICIGLNYRDHAAESGMDLPREPVFFNKYNNALVGSSGPVILPSNATQVDYEAELAVVIGRTAKRVPEENAMDFVAGFSVMHDVSARDWQFRTGQWVSGKTFDTFAPLGPYLVTPDEVADPHALNIRLTLNGKVMQDSNTRNLIFGIPALISYLSQIFTLVPGDIISTGTPPGVGFARKPPVFLRSGDVVEISVENIGVMKHRCISES